MGLFSKIVILVLAQVIVIVSCVYIYIDDFEIQESKVVTTKTSEDKQATTESSSIIQQVSNKITSALNDEKIQKNQTPIEVKKDTENSHKLIQKELKTTSPVKEKLEKEIKTVVKEVPKKEVPKIEKKIEKPTTLTQPSITDKKVKALFEQKKKEQQNVVEETKTQSVEIPYERIQAQINALVKKKRIIFKRLSTDVTEESVKTIEEISVILKKYPTLKVEVGGHTDAKGDKEVNAYISKHRALSVRKMLIKMGIDKNRLSFKGYGESQPIVENDPQGYSILNRRVEFKIIKE